MFISTFIDFNININLEENDENIADMQCNIKMNRMKHKIFYGYHP